MKQKTDIANTANTRQHVAVGPNRKALLAELESIHAALLECETTVKSSLADESEEQHSSEDASAEAYASSNQNDITQNTITERPDHEQNMPAKPAKVPNALPGQQCLFDIIPEEPALPAKSKKTEADSVKKAENPFLPNHVKDKLAQEKQHYQHELESVAKLSFGMSNGLSKAQSDALIETLVARYLPQIEQELRSELQKLLEKDHEPG
ncbi:hypothetical protein TDB9533_04364 [Thalassocella blandensis]|nr:hypothetical protein TDB9533_04364 [Thalassocella blandensis]